MNVSNIIKRHVTKNPEKTAIIFGERCISYSELDRLINRAAKGFTNLGLKQGDVLSLFLPSLPELIIAYMGSVRAEITLNLVNTMLQKTEKCNCSLMTALNRQRARHHNAMECSFIFK
jgi:long-chain acyl-CoA synthetase